MVLEQLSAKQCGLDYESSGILGGRASVGWGGLGRFQQEFAGHQRLGTICI